MDMTTHGTHVADQGDGMRGRHAQINRREMLRKGGIAAAGATSAALVGLDASPARAATNDVVMGRLNDAREESTALVSSVHNSESLRLLNGRAGGALRCSNTYLAVRPAVTAESFASGQPAVQALGRNRYGAALDVRGRAAFSRAGTAVIPPGEQSVLVGVPGFLLSNTFVLATVQTSYDEDITVKSAGVVSTQFGTTRITLTAPNTTGADIVVAYWVFEVVPTG
jgi:hypothetical protein